MKSAIDRLREDMGKIDDDDKAVAFWREDAEKAMALIEAAIKGQSLKKFVNALTELPFE